MQIAPARIVWTAALLLAVAAIGWIDYVTGPDVGFSLFYLIPIVIAGWFLGPLAAGLTSVSAAIAWFVADLVWQEPAFASISRWNGMTRLVIYTGIAGLVALARRDRDRLTELNSRLHAALGQQTALARTDMLTQLGNSRHFIEVLDHELRSGGAPGQLALVYIDIDNFKKVNDAYGHHAGDDLLRAIAQALPVILRPGDVLARVGGDEFAVLLRGLGSAEATPLLLRIARCIEQEGAAYPAASVAASIGLVEFSHPPVSADAAMKAADEAMYVAKSTAGSSIHSVRI